MADSICVSCGLCCDGTIFGHFELADDDDRSVLEAAGVALIRKEDRDVALQPCVALDGTRCSVYEGRPQICRSFRCMLLQQHDDGKTDTAEALSIIDATIELRERVRAAVDTYLGPNDESARLDDRMIAAREKIAGAPDPEAEESAQIELLMYMISLRGRVGRWFVAVGPAKTKRPGRPSAGGGMRDNQEKFSK